MKKVVAEFSYHLGASSAVLIAPTPMDVQQDQPSASGATQPYQAASKGKVHAAAVAKASKPSDGVEEVVVTASKRKQRLRDFGVTVSAFTSPTIGATTYTVYMPVSQESLQGYEAGVKTSLLQDTVLLTAAGITTTKISSLRPR